MPACATGMPPGALRQLGLGTVKRIYRLDVPELCTALKDAARRRIEDKTVWDALFYRTAVLRSELMPADLAVATDALARVRRKDAAFLDYMLQEMRAKARRFLLRDAAQLLNALAKLAVRDELLTQSLLPSLLRRISEKSRWEDLALLALSLTRLGDPAREPVFDRILSVLMPRMETLSDGHTLSLLACAFTRPPMGGGHYGSAEPLFAEDIVGSDVSNDGVDGVVHVAHIDFIEVLLQQCERHMWNFRSADLLHLCLALSTLARSGNEHIFPTRLFRRLERRMGDLHFEFMPAQYVRLLEQLAHLPELERKCASKLLDEIAYRMRDVTPQSCISVLRTVRRIGGHARAGSAASWRLVREDAASALTATQVCEAAEVFADLPPCRWESREALLCLLQGLQRRQVEPDPALLARLLRAYGELAVRDTHWFHLCSKLSTSNSTVQAKQVLSRGAALPPLDDTVAAEALLGLARLNLPQLVDASALFSRAVASVSSPVAAVTVLEAAAIFALIDRRPQELVRPGALAPLLAMVRGDPSVLPRLRLFPFTDLAVSGCEKEVVAEWQAVAAKVHAAPRAADAFEVAMSRELSTWLGVGLVPRVAVGPLCVPWALSLVGLAEHLRANPLDKSAPPIPSASEIETAVEDQDSEDVEVASAEVAEGSRPRGGRRAGRRTQRDRPAASSSVHATVAFGEARSDTHVLVLPLREQDFYHASATLRGERQRSKKQLLGAERYAEISLIRRMGWRVCGVPERLWTWGPDNDPETASANRELVFRVIAGISDEP